MSGVTMTRRSARSSRRGTETFAWSAHASTVVETWNTSTAFGDAHLYTRHADLTARTSGGKVKWKTKPPTKADDKVAPHNREKDHLIPAGKPCAFLAESA